MNYFFGPKRLLSKQEREKRFPICNFEKNKVVARKIGISTLKIDPYHIILLIEEYSQTLSTRNIWLNKWENIIKNELEVLSKYNMDNVDRLLIVQNEYVVFDFYLLKDIYIDEQDMVLINLDNFTPDKPGFFSNILSSLGVAVSFGSLGYLISTYIYMT